MAVLEASLVALLVLSCLALAVQALLGIRTRRALRQVADLPTPEGPLPPLSVVVAARDEVRTLEPAARTLLASDYCELELVLVDDRSTDGTGDAVDRLASEDARVRPLHVSALPDGWLGKVHAMERGREAARGEWLLFTDADVHFAPGTLARVVGHAERAGLDHVTVLPRIDAQGFWTDAAVASFGGSLSTVQRVWKVADPDSSAYLGIGAFNLARRSALERAAAAAGAGPGLAWLRLEVAEDLGLGLMLKRSGARCEVLAGRDALSVAWYAGLGDMAVGLEKNLFAVAGRCRLRRVVPRAAGLVAGELAPFAALAVGLAGGRLWLAVLAAGALLLASASAVRGARWLGQRVAPALLRPVGGLLFAAILLRAGWLGWRRGGIYWRGTFYPSDVLREGLRVRMP